jgi:hypothetical protein
MRFIEIAEGIKSKYRAAIRGGNWNNGANAGCFNLNLNNAPSNTNTNIGFRCCQYSLLLGQNKISTDISQSQKTTDLIPFRIGVKAERENIKPVPQRSRSRVKSETSSLG